MKLKFYALSCSCVSVILFSSSIYAAGYEWSPASFHNPAAMVATKKADVRAYLNEVITYNTFDGKVVDNFGTTVGPGRAVSDPIWGYPSFDAKFRISPKAVIGLDLNKPYGVDVNYPIGSVVSPTGTITKLDVVQITPSFAYSVTPKFALGFGINILGTRAGLGAVPYFPSQGQFLTKFGHTFGMGAHFGFLYQIFTPTFFDMVYYPQKRVYASGKSTLANIPVSNNVSATLVMPTKVRATLTQFFKPNLYAYVTADFTQWGKIQQIVLDNNLGPGLNSVIQLNYRNVLAFYLGALWDITEKITIDGGLGFDPSSVNHKRGNSAPNLPAGTDNTSFWFEGTYTFAKPFRVNVGYSHYFMARTTSVGPDPTFGKVTSVGVNKKDSNSFWLGFFYVV